MTKGMAKAASVILKTNLSRHINHRPFARWDWHFFQYSEKCRLFVFHMLQNGVGSWWRHQMETFSSLLALCAGKSRSLVNSPPKDQWRGALVFSLTCAWINGWINNDEAGDLRRHRAHYDVSVMSVTRFICTCCVKKRQHTVFPILTNLASTSAKMN